MIYGGHSITPDEVQSAPYRREPSARAEHPELGTINGRLHRRNPTRAMILWADDAHKTRSAWVPAEWATRVSRTESRWLTMPTVRWAGLFVPHREALLRSITGGLPDSVFELGADGAHHPLEKGTTET